jgi:hypothetical protein
MPRPFRSILLVVLSTGTLVAAGQKFTSTWKSPATEGMSFTGKKVAALVMTDDESLRMSSEEALVREMGDRGIDAIAAYRIIPREELKDKDAAKGWLERAGVAGIVVLRPISAEQEKVYAPSVWVTSYYSTLWGYYGYGWTSVYSPGGSRVDTYLIVETLIYGVPDGQLLWAGASEAKNPKNVQTYMKALVKETVKEMNKQGLAKGLKR